jgi:transposase-like protein
VVKSDFGKFLYDCLDGIVFNIRENGKVINKTVYLCVGLNKKSLKEVLSMWIGKNGSAALGIGALTDLKARSLISSSRLERLSIPLISLKI